MNYSKLLLGLSLSLFIVFPLHAEDADSARGRLPDGRAFRTDAQGNQLVDYIAELELSVEQLTRRVNGLEFEVEEKQNLISRLSKSDKAGRDLEERDLLGGKQNPAPETDRFANTGWKDRETSNAAANPVAVDCTSQTASAEQMLEKARFDLEVARRVQDKSRLEYEDNVEKLRAQYSTLSCPKADCSAEVSKASAPGIKYQQELEQTQSAYNAEREAQQKRIQEYETSLVRLKNEVTDRDSQLRELKAKLTIANTQEAKSGTIVSVTQRELAPPPLDRVASLRVVEPPFDSPAKVIEVTSEKTGVESAQGSTMQQVARSTHPQLFSPPVDQRASFSAAKTRAVDSLRGSMTGDLRRVRDLISTRDSLFQSYNQSGRALSFKPSPLTSSRGFTYSWVAERVRTASNVYELSSLSRDIREIRSRVQDDIDLIKRMQRQ